MEPAAMRWVEHQEVVQVVERLCIDACHVLPPDVLSSLQRAAGRESRPVAREVIERLIANASVAASQQIPLCQDTGLTVVFVEHGAQVAIRPPQTDPKLTVIDAIQAGVQAGYAKGFLRKSVVADPLQGRRNTGTNTPAIIHCSIVPGDRLRLTVMVKGGGCENKSQFRMFNPTADSRQVSDWIARVVETAGADACPPLVVGVGIGGDFETCCLLAKKALLRGLDSPHPDPFYARLEQDLLSAINACGLGPQGLGGESTALAVLIETAPCHIASLPVAVNVECHSHRHQTAVL
jgi:fumarate hydratase subunit alpha